MIELLAETTGFGAWTVDYTPAATSLTSTYRIDIIAYLLPNSIQSHPTITSPAAGSVTGPNVTAVWSPAADVATSYAELSVQDAASNSLYQSGALNNTSTSLTGLPAGTGELWVYPLSTVSLSATQVTLTLLSGPDLNVSIPPNMLYESWVANQFKVAPEPVALAAGLPIGAAVLFRRGRRTRD